MRKYYVGDRVWAFVRESQWMAATLKRVQHDYDMPIDKLYGVETDEPFGGHTCSGYSKQGHGWNCMYDEIKLLHPTENRE